MSKFHPFLLIALLLITCCTREHTLRQQALRQLTITMDRSFKEVHGIGETPSIKGEVQSIYESDSLCIYQLAATAGDKEYTLRYVYLLDKFMSWAGGHPVYCDVLFGAEPMNKKKIREVQEQLRNDNGEVFAYYTGVTQPITEQ